MQRARCLVVAAFSASFLAQVAAFAADDPAWPYVVEIPRPRQGEQPEKPYVAKLWLPANVKTVRGLFYPGGIVIGDKLAHDEVVRATLAEEGMGLLFFGVGLTFMRGGGEVLERGLAELARQSGHPEVQYAPLITAGHSTDGIFCRNVAYWKPDRVAGVIMIKSGNFHHSIEDLSRTIAGVPLTLISGEFEEYGPEGGDLGVGLRSEYSSHPTDRKKLNQTQWVMARMQMIERRRKNPDNLWALVVHRGGGHTAWDNEMRDLTCKIIRGYAAARIPKSEPDGGIEVRCNRLTAADGWLYDADIKNPAAHKPAPFTTYDGDRIAAFWAPDQALAEAIFAYHSRGWEHPDPTAGQPPETRFAPPQMLRDLVDAPPPKPLAWAGGDGQWDATAARWTDDGRNVAWDASREAVFGPGSGTIALATNLACQGLRLGRETALDLGDRSLRVRWHAVTDEASTVRVRVAAEAGKIRSGRLSIDGNATLAGRLVIESAGEFPKGGSVGILSVSGLRKADFRETVLPPGWEARWGRRGLEVVIPKPAPAAK